MRLSGLAACMILTVGTVLGDVIIEKDGTRTSGKIVQETESLLTLELEPGMQVEIERKNIQEIQRGKASSATTPAREQPPGKSQETPSAAIRPSASPKAMSDKERKGWLVHLKEVFEHSKQRLEVWPVPPEPEKIAEDTPKDAEWKIIHKDGRVEHARLTPAPGDYLQVWGKSRPQVRTMVHYVGGGYVDTTRADLWIPMYYHDATQDWGASHPCALALKRDQDSAVYLLQEILRGMDAKAASEVNTAWYAVLNARAGAPKDEQVIQADLNTQRETLKSLTFNTGDLRGVGSQLSRIQELTLDIHLETDIRQKVNLARERRKIFEELFKILS